METHNKHLNRSAVFFDSGIGGLNLLYECVKRVPGINYYYLSDNKNMPYGNKSADELLTLTQNALRCVEEIKPSVLVIACNTVTANCIDSLRAVYDFPVVGIQPAIKQATEVGGRCLVLATNATVNSLAFKKLLAHYDQGVEVVGCSRLAEYVEKNIFNLPPILPQGLLPIAEADCVVLGCTHYSFVKEQIKAFYGCPVLDGVGATADHFFKILGMTDHQPSILGKNIHKGEKKSKITFLGANSEINFQTFKFLFKTYV